MLDRPPAAFRRVDLDVLAAIVRGDVDAVLRSSADGAFDADRFVAFAAAHQLAGFVHARIEGTPARTAFSPGAAARLAGAYVRQWTTNERLAREVRDLAGTFERAGCPFVLLKGLHTALAYHGGIDRRGMADLDVLVRRSDLDRAMRLLAARGFARRSHALFGRHVAAAYTHAFEFVREGVPIDLHWALAAHPSYRIDYDALWARRRRFDAAGTAVDVLDDADALAFQVLGIAKDLELGTVTLKSFVDLHAMVRAVDATSAWEAFFATRARERTARTAAAILDLVLRTLGDAAAFPALDGWLRRHAPPTAPDGLAARVAKHERSARDRLWAAGLYETSAARVWTWWALSLPFRVAAHRTMRTPEPAPR